MKTFFMLTCGLVLATGSLAQAQVPETTVTTTTTTLPASPAGTVRVSQILGSTVHLQGTNNYGKVDDVILDENGGPAYLVVANRGRHALFPYRAGTFQPAQRTVIYDVTPQAVQPLFFNPTTYPSVTDPAFTTRTSQVFRERIRVRVKPNGTVKETIRP